MFKNNFFNFFNNIPLFKKDSKMIETQLNLISISETIQHNLPYALTTNQLLVSKGILEVFKTQNLIKTVQLISQPQVGKTGTILHALAQIKIYAKEKYPDKMVRFVFIQPSDNELKEQLKARLIEFKYKNQKTNKFECLEDYNRPGIKPLIYTTADFSKNKNGQSKTSIDLQESIKIWRENQDIIVFVHDESHRDCGEKGTFDKFSSENKVYFWGKQQHETAHDNVENELYLKITASASNFIRYAKSTTKHPPTCFYIKPGILYKSFEELINTDRFREGFFIKDKQQIRRFIIECLCENFLLNDPGCFIVRLGQNEKKSEKENSNMFKKIQEEIEIFVNNKQLLKEELNKNGKLTDIQINTVLEKIEKIKSFLFISTSNKNDFFKKYPDIFEKDQKREEDKLKTYDDEKINTNKKREKELINSIDSNENVLEIGMMRYFLKDNTQNEDFKLLFIVNSFLQGKTLNLNNVKGWFERYADNADTANQAFTIQSIGRNCGNHMKDYDYPIWTNIELIEKLVCHYDSIAGSVDSLTSKITSFENIIDITSTHIKSLLCKNQNKKQFKLNNPNSLNTFEFEVKICNTKQDAINEIENHFKNKNFDLTELSYHIRNETIYADYLKKYKTLEEQKLNPFVPIDKENFTLKDFFDRNTYLTKISAQTKKNAMKIVNDGKFARFCHTSGGSRNFHDEFPNGFRYGIVELDHVANNAEYQKTWNDIIEKNQDHPLYQKQGYCVAYFERDLIPQKDKMNNDNQRIMVDTGSVDRRFV